MLVVTATEKKTRTSGHLPPSSYAVNTYTHSCWQLWGCHPTSASHLMMNTPSVLFLHQLWHIFLSTQGNLCIEKRHWAGSNGKHSLNADVSWQASSRGMALLECPGMAVTDSWLCWTSLEMLISRGHIDLAVLIRISLQWSFCLVLIYFFFYVRGPSQSLPICLGDYMHCFACCWPEQSFLTIKKFLSPLCVLKLSFWCGVTFWILFLAGLNRCPGIFPPSAHLSSLESSDYMLYPVFSTPPNSLNVLTRDLSHCQVSGGVQLCVCIRVPPTPPTLPSPYTSDVLHAGIFVTIRVS